MKKSDSAGVVAVFPLPVENIGTESGLEVLKLDLLARLLRFDPTGKFVACHSSLEWDSQSPQPGNFQDKKAD